MGHKSSTQSRSVIVVAGGVINGSVSRPYFLSNSLSLTKLLSCSGIQKHITAVGSVSIDHDDNGKN